MARFEQCLHGRIFGTGGRGICNGLLRLFNLPGSRRRGRFAFQGMKTRAVVSIPSSLLLVFLDVLPDCAYCSDKAQNRHNPA